MLAIALLGAAIALARLPCCRRSGAAGVDRPARFGGPADTAQTTVRGREMML